MPGSSAEPVWLVVRILTCCFLHPSVLGGPRDHLSWVAGLPLVYIPTLLTRTCR